MADERTFGTQELVSAKYLAAAEENCEAELDDSLRGTRPRRSRSERAMQWLTAIVALMLVTAGSGIYWLNRASIASTAGDLAKRRSLFNICFL